MPYRITTIGDLAPGVTPQSLPLVPSSLGEATDRVMSADRFAILAGVLLGAVLVRALGCAAKG